MAEVHNDPYSERTHVTKSNAARNITILVAAILVIVGALFYTGFWSADVEGGDMPKVSVNGGELPAVDVDSKEVVVGTKEETVEVPTVGIKDDGEE